MIRLHPVPASLPFWHPALVIATWFGAGRLGPAAGSWGSLAALPFAWVIHDAGGGWVLAAAALALFAIGVWASGRFVAASGDSDPSPVVVDEVVGQWLTLAVVPGTLETFALGFLLFRVADVVKPFPAGWADREVKGGLGVMLDDLLAAAWSAAALWGLWRWAL
jgi:phosphatidylglycerophosphatase A